jgi:hypothetical protein
MAENFSVSGPIDVSADSPQRVAYDLMTLIASYENKSAQKDRRYWLTLFYQCVAVSRGKVGPANLDTILQLDQRDR